MKITCNLLISILGILLFTSGGVYSQMKEGEDILPSNKWDLTPLFDSDEDIPCCY